MTFEKVRDIIAEQLEIDPGEIMLESSLADDLKADSVDVVGIIMNLEAEFGLEFPFEDLESIKTVSDAVSYIDERVQ
ncbi:MAG: acyl carrier protein [Clostridiales bacterium]|nr:acyl carrier protein [Clostridiales bacterium]